MLYMSRPSTPAASLTRLSASLAARAWAASAVFRALATGTTTTPSSSAITTSPGWTRAPAQTTGMFTEPSVALTVPRALIARLNTDFHIDTARIYATGISNGGFFSQRIACDLSAQVAAVAGVASTLQESLAAACKPQRSVPVLVMMGSKDPLVPWDGGALSGNRGAVLSAPEAVRKWAVWDGCEMTPAPKEPFPRTHVDLYNQCAEGAEVILYRVEGGGHTWPGGRQYFPEFFIGKTSRDFDAGEVIWQFFEKHPLR